MGFCCATSPVVASAIRTREWPFSRVFVGLNRQNVRSGHYGEVRDFFCLEVAQPGCRSAGSTIIGEYSDKHHARRAMLLGLLGWRPVERKQA